MVEPLDVFKQRLKPDQIFCNVNNKYTSSQNFEIIFLDMDIKEGFRFIIFR